MVACERHHEVETVLTAVTYDELVAALTKGGQEAGKYPQT